MTTIPQELADARRNAVLAWDAYNQVVDREHTREEWQRALDAARLAEAVSSQWYRRWQDLGGTSDISSIVESENVWMEKSMTKTAAWIADGVSSPEWFDAQPERSDGLK